MFDMHVFHRSSDNSDLYFIYYVHTYERKKMIIIDSNLYAIYGVIDRWSSIIIININMWYLLNLTKIIIYTCDVCCRNWTNNKKNFKYKRNTLICDTSLLELYYCLTNPVCVYTWKLPCVLTLTRPYAKCLYINVCTHTKHIFIYNWSVLNFAYIRRSMVNIGPTNLNEFNKFNKYK